MKYSLKALRVNKGMKQEESAEKLGIDVSTLQRYERGKAFPNVLMIEKITKLYGVKYDDINFFVYWLRFKR